jgi:hypothetical protein
VPFFRLEQDARFPQTSRLEAEMSGVEVDVGIPTTMSDMRECAHLPIDQKAIEA